MKKNNKMNKNTNVERMIQYNNRGAFLIECGQYQKAIQCLRIGNEMLVNEMEKKHLQETTAAAAGINNKESSPIFLTIDCTENSKKCRHPCTLEDSYSTGGGGGEGGGSPLAERPSTTTTHRRRPSKNIVNQHQHDYLFSEHHHHARSSSHNNAEAAGTGINMMTKTKRMILLRQDHDEEEEQEQGFISRRPMRVSCLPPERWDYILSVIFLFNLALSHQLLARSFSSSPSNKKNMVIGHGATTTTNIQHKNNNRLTPTMARMQRERHVRASLFFYQCAFTMKNRGYLHFDTSFALAMVNNTANVLFELGYKERAQKLQQLMLTTLMMVVVDNQKRNDNDNKESSLLSTIDDMEGFMVTATQSMASKEGPTTAMIA